MAEKTVSARVTLDASQAASALRGFGEDAKVSFDMFTRKTREASAAADQVGESVQGFERNMRNAFGQLGFQVQDVVVQLQQGTGVIQTFTQQGLQLAGAFGPIPALVAGVGAAIVAAGAAFLGFNRDVEKTPPALANFLGSLDNVGIKADEVRAKLEGLTEAQRGLAQQRAEQESEQISEEAGQLTPQLLEQLYSQSPAVMGGLKGRFLAQELEKIPPQERVGQGLAVVERAQAAAQTRFEQINNQIIAAVNAGDVDKVEGLIRDLGLQNIPENQELTDRIRDAAKRKALTKVAQEATSQTSELGAGFKLPDAAPVNLAFTSPLSTVGADLSDPARRTPVPVVRDEAAIDADNERRRLASEQRKAKDDADKARRDAQAQAETDRINREVEARQRIIQAAEQEAESAERLAVAKRQDFEQTKKTGEAKNGEAEASKRVQIEIESERRIREASKTLSGQELETYKQSEARRVAAAQATADINAAEREYLETRKESIAAQERLLELQNQANPPDPRVTAQLTAQRSLGPGATPEEQAEAATAAGKIYDNQQKISGESERFAEQQAQIFLRPFEDLASRISSLTTQVFDEFLATGTLSVDKLAENIASSTRSITANMLGTLVSAPLNQAVSQLGPMLNKAFAEGGSISGTLGQFARDNPLTAGLAGGTLGITAGNTITAMRGGNQFGSTVGGTLGAGGGFMLGNMLLPGVGGFIGAGLGGLGGGFLGGLFGGEKNLGNDRASLDYWTSVGTSWQDKNSSPENRQAVNAFASEVDSLIEALAGLGATVGNLNLRFEAGNKTGLVFNGQEYGSQEALMAGVIKFVGSQAQGLSESQQTVVRNTKAGSVQEFASDLAFAEQVDRVSRNLGPFATQLADLEDSFTGMKVKAEQLGLATDGLSAAYQRQQQEIRDAAQDQIDAFTTGGGIRGQIKGIKQQAEDLTQMGQELGLATGQIAGAMRKQIAEIRNAVKDQVDAFRSGGRTAGGQALVALKGQFEDVQEAAREAGVSTAGLTQAYNQQRQAIRQSIADQVIAFRNQSRSGVAQSLVGLKAQFDEVAKSARDVGVSTAGLTQAYNQQRAAIRKEAQETVRQYTRDDNPVADARLENNRMRDEMRKMARDVGINPREVDNAWRRENRQIRQGVEQEIRGFTKGRFVAAFDELEDKFQSLRQAAQAVGRGVGDLTGAYRKQVEQLKENAREAIATAERSYTEGVRGLKGIFEGLIEPLQQATGPFGIGQGIAAPRATVTGGIEQFREQLALAREGDVEAIQSLTSLGQQTIGVARQYGASGSEFGAIFKEVNAGLVEMQSRLQDRQLEALRGLKDVGRETLDEMVKLRREGIANVVDELKQLRLEFRQLQDRVA